MMFRDRDYRAKFHCVADLIRLVAARTVYAASAFLAGTIVCRGLWRSSQKRRLSGMFGRVVTNRAASAYVIKWLEG